MNHGNGRLRACYLQLASAMVLHVRLAVHVATIAHHIVVLTAVQLLVDLVDASGIFIVL